jgi:hypothetical protein
MKANINIYIKYYLSILLFFSIIYLYEKHNVGNDSTISEWLINYSGGFTRRGIIGQISIYFAKYFNLNLRDSILIFQILILMIYFISLYYFLRDIKINKIIILAIFTPIFILYPVAEIEVLARKEIFIFCFYLFYLFLNKNIYRFYYKLLLLPLAVLIWEPVIFFLMFFLVLDIIEIKSKKLDFDLMKILSSYIPTIILVFYIALNPLDSNGHAVMAKNLMMNFNETCYMACRLLKSKSSIYAQFAGNFNSYSFVVFFRYSLIILFGFGPLFLLLLNSSLKDKQTIFFKKFDSMIIPVFIIFSPVIVLFAMGYDWGRWVNITYVFSIMFFLYLYKNDKIILNTKFLDNKILKKLNNKKIFILFFIIYCFGWNPKTVITGDVGSKPGYQIPRKAAKVIYYNYLRNKDFFE